MYIYILKLMYRKCNSPLPLQCSLTSLMIHNAQLLRMHSREWLNPFFFPGLFISDRHFLGEIMKVILCHFLLYCHVLGFLFGLFFFFVLFLFFYKRQKSPFSPLQVFRDMQSNGIQTQNSGTD